MEYKFFLIDKLYFELVKAEGRYVCAFLEGDKELYSAEIGEGEWIATDRQYLSDYYVEIRTLEGKVKHKVSFLEILKDKKVFISLDSKALGDTIAWVPYFLEFKERYKCEVVVSTFKNFLFKDMYPELTWVEPGSVVNGIHCMLKVGWHFDFNKEPIYPPLIPLQRAATEIMHLPYKEIRPRIKHNKYSGDEKFVCISTKSTSELKLWDKWEELTAYLNSKGYKVYEISSEESDIPGVINPENTSLDYTMELIDGCKFYIGLSSGLSWLAWAMNKPVVMISNFTNSDHEFECIRITNTQVCHGCWNDPMFKFDKGNWWWCPRHEDTPRQFECHKSISVNDVTQQLQLLL